MISRFPDVQWCKGAGGCLRSAPLLLCVLVIKALGLSKSTKSIPRRGYARSNQYDDSRKRARMWHWVLHYVAHLSRFSLRSPSVVTCSSKTLFTSLIINFHVNRGLILDLAVLHFYLESLLGWFELIHIIHRVQVLIENSNPLDPDASAPRVDRIEES